MDRLENRISVRGYYSPFKRANSISCTQIRDNKLQNPRNRIRVPPSNQIRFNYAMDFDEYDYLEKSVEGKDNVSSKKIVFDNSDREYKRRDKEDREKGDRKRSIRSRDIDEDLERSIRSDRERKPDRDRGSRDRERSRRDRDKDDEKEARVEREKCKDRERSRRSRSGSGRHESDKDRERSRRSRSSSRRHESDRDRKRSSRSRSSSRRRESEREIRERDREIETRESRRFRDKKEALEPEADPERDQRTVFAYQMPLKATERDVYEFFTKAGKVRDVRLIMDRNSRRSKGVGYIEFYDAMSVPMAIALSGHLLHGQPVMVKPSEAEKNLVQSTATGGASAGLSGPYGPVDRKLYVGNLHFNMTEHQLRQIFEAFGNVELVQLPLDPETGHCKGFGFIQFSTVEHAKAAQSLNGTLDIAGRTIKVSSVTDHVGSQETGAKVADFDDDDGGGLALNAQSRALLMQKLDRTGIASSIVGSLGSSTLNGSVTNQHTFNLPFDGQSILPATVYPPQVASPLEIVGSPSTCLLLKNMFDPATELEPDFYLDIKEDVEEECSKFGRVEHIFVDKNSAGHVYIRFESVQAAQHAQQSMHMRWFARKMISAVFMQPYEYDAKFKPHT